MPAVYVKADPGAPRGGTCASPPYQDCNLVPGQCCMLDCRGRIIQENGADACTPISSSSSSSSGGGSSSSSGGSACPPDQSPTTNGCVTTTTALQACEDAGGEWTQGGDGLWYCDMDEGVGGSQPTCIHDSYVLRNTSCYEIFVGPMHTSTPACPDKSADMANCNCLGASYDPPGCPTPTCPQGQSGTPCKCDNGGDTASNCIIACTGCPYSWQTKTGCDGSGNPVCTGTKPPSGSRLLSVTGFDSNGDPCPPAPPPSPPGGGGTPPGCDGSASGADGDDCDCGSEEDPAPCPSGDAITTTLPSPDPPAIPNP